MIKIEINLAHQFFIAFLSFIISLSSPVFASAPSLMATPTKNICESQGSFVYVSLQDIMAGQTFMSEEAIDNISNDLRKPGFFKDEATGQIKFCYDNGKSPFNKSFKVLLAPPGIVDEKNKPFKYVLVDGHHTVGGTLLGARKAGANEETLRNLSISVKIDEKYKDLSLEKFWKKIREENLVYTDQSGSLSPRHLIDVPNDDMRGFLEQAVVGCSESKPIKYNSSPNTTLWMRIGGETVHASVPFIEFYISDALKDGGFEYKKGTPLSSQQVDQARQVLIKNPQLLNQKRVFLIEFKGEKPFIYGSKMTPEEYCKSFMGFASNAANDNKAQNVSKPEPLKSDSNGKNLLEAAKTANIPLFKKLLEEGADIAVVDEKGHTPLHFAALSRNLYIIDLIVTSGKGKVDVNARTNIGFTPLHLAAINGDLAALDYLVRNGADIEAIGPAGNILDIAYKYGKMQVIDYLKSRNIMMNPTRSNAPIEREKNR